MVDPKSSIATRKEIKVPKKPLASWTRLVAMISVVICARIPPLDGIGSPFSGGLSRKLQRQSHLILPSSSPAVSTHGPKAPSLSHEGLTNCRHMHLQGWSKLPWGRQRFLPVSEVPLDVPP